MGWQTGQTGSWLNPPNVCGIKPAKQNGTQLADTIRASGQVTASKGRTQDCTRPTPSINSSLAMREPSKQDIPLGLSSKTWGREAFVAYYVTNFQLDNRWACT